MTDTITTTQTDEQVQPETLTDEGRYLVERVLADAHEVARDLHSLTPSEAVKLLNSLADSAALAAHDIEKG